VTLPGYELDRQNGLIELSTISCLLRFSRHVDGAELDESVVALHVDPDQLPERLKEHLKIFPSGRLLVEVHHEQGIAWLDVLPAFVFLLLDPSISTGELGPNPFRHVRYLSVCWRVRIEKR